MLWVRSIPTGAKTWAQRPLQGLGNFPAKFSFDITATNCGDSAHPDFVVYNTGLTGVPNPSGQASIIAYDNLYTGGCTAPTPKTYWAYNTAGGKIVTSVIFSPDGTQVAFAQTTGSSASLVIMKWAASTVETASSPMTLAITPASTYRGCSAPCMTSVSFAGGANDSGSSPFFDYTPGSDVLYIGDDAGKLHKFTGVFAGAIPAEMGGAWPVTVSTQPLGGPVLDTTSGNIFVGDYLLDTFFHLRAFWMRISLFCGCLQRHRCWHFKPARFSFWNCR